MLEELYAKSGINIKIQTYQSWINDFISLHYAKDHEDKILSDTQFQTLLLDDDGKQEDDTTHNSASNKHPQQPEMRDGDGDYILKERKRVKPRMVIPMQCYHHFTCPRGLQCQYSHTEEEREFFRIQPDETKRRRYKITRCTLTNCPYRDKTYLCGWAHSLEESRCPCCRKQGEHWMQDCPLYNKHS